MPGSNPLTGEPLALDLVNTRPAGPGGRTDLIDTPGRLAAWLALEAERLPAEFRGVAPGPEDLPPLHRVREHVEAVVRALLGGAAPPAAALHGLSEAQRAAPATREVGWDGAAVTAEPRRVGPLGVRLAALLAEAAVDLLTAPAVGRIRECEADGCVMLFLPSHPRRRWCSPSRCGNRARVARYYQRHRPTAGGGE
ncbi:CGNR zinc finger domain-containing protein [Allostreptomyces psammosilenae]|uniref:Putative RNA-binding Zn ribbon-like protein n=1 Tax=Allostreptomyces psammosilenae TaxID=1892865 RepID=A0A852ZQI1_9ACTN|nr:CGNR zinc finger domain-containing protein [Allostreptomyces psammosilenae]NYI03530.1 putative RNA-binding Zn ribbon-like protein [Allostreptomyces psammosilenae]